MTTRKVDLRELQLQALKQQRLELEDELQRAKDAPRLDSMIAEEERRIEALKEELAGSKTDAR